LLASDTVSNEVRFRCFRQHRLAKKPPGPEGVEMPLPNDASIEEVARELGVTDEELNQLTPGARQLTKGDLLALLGADTEAEAAAVFGATGGTLLPKPKLTPNVEGLTVADRASLGKAFGRLQEQAFPLLRTGPSLDEAVGALAMGDVKCCCCPCTCCCAAAVAKPARIS
jgi:hypothetical protein